MAKHTCPSCGHIFSNGTVKTKSGKKSSNPYQYAEIVFADGISVLRGSYSGSKDHVAEGAIYMRALALSGGRWLNKANITKVPSVEEVHWLVADEIDTVRDFAFKQRENLIDGWGRNLTDTKLMRPSPVVFAKPKKRVS